jgi:hypothetical protein
LAHTPNETFTIGLGTTYTFSQNIGIGTNIASWFINAPQGIRAVVVGGGNINDPDVTVRFEGTPHWTNYDRIEVRVPNTVLRNLPPRVGQAVNPFFPPSVNNYWNIEPLSNRTARLSDVEVSGVIGRSLDYPYLFTTTVTLTDDSFVSIIDRIPIGDHDFDPDNGLFYTPNGNGGFDPINLSEYGISAVFRGDTPDGSETAVIEFSGSGNLSRLLVEPIYIGLRAVHLTSGGRYPADANGVVLYSELNRRAVFDIQPDGMLNQQIHAFANNPIRGSGTNGRFTVHLPYPENITFTNALMSAIAIGEDVRSWFEDSLPDEEPASFGTRVEWVSPDRRQARFAFMGNAGVRPFNERATINIPGRFISNGEEARIRNLNTFVSVAAVEVQDMTISGQAGVPMHPAYIDIVLHGLKPSGDETFDASWFRNPDDGSAFFSTNPGLEYRLITDVRNGVEHMQLRVFGTPLSAFSGPFMLDIPSSAFTWYTGASTFPGSQPGLDLAGNPITGPVTIRSNVAQRFEISQGDFIGSVSVQVSDSSRGGAGVFRTVTVTATDTEEDVWLWISGSTLGTGHSFTELVRVPASGSGYHPIRSTTRHHTITASSPSEIEISVIRITTADTMPNLVTPNYERVRLSVPPMIRQTTLLP